MCMYNFVVCGVGKMAQDVEKVQRCRKDFLIGGAQSETTYRVVSNLYNNL